MLDEPAGSMECPQCPDTDMQSRPTREGVDLEACPRCGAVWFDRGEIFFFVRDPRRVATAIDTARLGQAEETWLEGSLGLDLLFLLERETGSVFLPAATVASLLHTGDLTLAWHEASTAEPVAFARPSLVIRAVLALLILYALLLAGSMGVLTQTDVDPWVGMPIAFFGLVLSFLAGPWLIDLSVQWFYGAQRRSLDDLPSHLKAFVHRTCAAQRMQIPRFYVIGDGSPEAFTYGPTPSTARIVLSQGLIELLEPEELEAVVGHELGHAVHWDLLIMTAADAVPQLLSMLRSKLEARSDDEARSRKGNVLVAGALFVAEVISEYAVLWLSRTREYHADRFGALAVGSAAAMGRALVKVAYGLAATPRRRESTSTGALGIFDRRRAVALALSTRGTAAQESIDESALLGAMKWDLWNPWARIDELHSTHPLVAKRLLHLTGVSEELGETAWLRFDLPRPESYWDEFLVDLCVALAPMSMGVLAFALQTAYGNPGLGAGLVLVGVAWAVKLRFRYPTTVFPEMSVATLMRCVKVSGVRPIPCRVEGVVIGRGEPGLIWSEDFVLRDGTGLVYVDHRQPFAIWEFLWGLLAATTVIQGDTVVEGWFRRTPVPHIEVRRFWVDGKVRRSWLLPFLWSLALLLVVAGVVLAVSATLWG